MTSSKTIMKMNVTNTNCYLLGTIQPIFCGICHPPLLQCRAHINDLLINRFDISHLVLLSEPCCLLFLSLRIIHYISFSIDLYAMLSLFSSDLFISMFLTRITKLALYIHYTLNVLSQLAYCLNYLHKDLKVSSGKRTT